MHKTERFKIRTWKDNTGGELEVCRWGDGDTVFRISGETPSVLLTPAKLAEMVHFIRSGEP